MNLHKDVTRGDGVRPSPLVVVPKLLSPRAWGEGSREPTSAEAQERGLGPNKTPQAPAGSPWSELGPQINSQRGPLEAWGLLEIDGSPDEEPIGPWSKRAPKDP